MVPNPLTLPDELWGFPRASGDGPAVIDDILESGNVSPARAGMVPSV